MIDKSVFAKARCEDVRKDPFPHLVIENALAARNFDNLLRSRPPFTGGEDADNRRTATPAWVFTSTDVFDPVWSDFVSLHTRPEITRHVLSLFTDHLTSPQPDLPASTRFGIHGITANWTTADVLTDTRLEIISPAHTAGSHRKGHLDTANRLFSALFYLRAADDTSTGGGLDLFRWKDGPKAKLDVFELPEDDIEHVLTVPYKANTLVVFPNSPHALHGAEIRQPTKHDRAYVFITAEVEKDLF
ncbi:MAG: 2OG-Fe(II) oxygenase [Rhodospirillales bacterium]|nr:2OG-Fe(II) oxygenase [Rhodospirillales bacterium]